MSIYTDLIRQHIAYDPDAGTLTWKEDSELGRKGESAVKAAFIDSGWQKLRIVIGCEVYEAIDVAWFLSRGAWPVRRVWYLSGFSMQATNLHQPANGTALKTSSDVVIDRDVLKQVYRTLPDGDLRRAVVEAFLRNEGVERCP